MFSYPYSTTKDSEFTSTESKLLSEQLELGHFNLFQLVQAAGGLCLQISEAVSGKVSKLWTCVFSHSPLPGYPRETDVKQNIHSAWFLQKTNCGRTVMHAARTFEGKR